MRYGLLIILFWSTGLLAAEFVLPSKGNDLVGEVQSIIITNHDTFATIAQRYNVTFTGLMEANPSSDPTRPGKEKQLIIPSAYVLPNVPRKGIIINIAELRLYYYPSHSNQVYTYPVGIGNEGWNITPGEFKIVQKKQNPGWHPTVSTRAELLRKGYNIPTFIPPGPDNPLGDYMLRLSNWTYLIHGVVDPTTVGRRSSSGCFRMYPKDIQQVFNMVPIKTPVRVIDAPYKVGLMNGKVYLEAHLPLQEDSNIPENQNLSSLVKIINAVVNDKPADIHWNQAFQVAREHRGIPEEIGAIK